MTPAPNARQYVIGSVVSRDGTTIAYRQFGEGPGIIAIHGAAQAAQNFTRLAEALSDAFSVYVPDRRGRGRSGPPGSDYSLRSECEDVEAILAKTGSHNVFGLSSGAIIALQAALTIPAIQKVALYEPPLSINHSTPIDWLNRYERELAAGRLGSAMVTAIRGTQTAPAILRLIPRFVLDPVLDAATRAGAPSTYDRRTADEVGLPSPRRRWSQLILWPLRRADSKKASPESGLASSDDVPLRALVPLMHYDAQLVIETEGALLTFRAVPAEVLLLGGTKSARYLRTSLHALGLVLPHARLVELAGCDHLAPDNGGNPERVAVQLRRFFSRAEARSSTHAD